MALCTKIYILLYLMYMNNNYIVYLYVCQLHFAFYKANCKLKIPFRSKKSAREAKLKQRH